MAVLDIKLPGDIDLDTSVNPNSLLQEEGASKPSPAGDVGLGKMAQALAAEVAIAEGGRTAAAFTGPIGYIIGALGSGAAGSYAAQRITNPDDISEGRLIADAFINLIPGLKAAKGAGVMNSALKQGAVGAGIGAGGITAETAIDEGRMPTIDELTTAGLTGGALGGALGLTGAGISSLLTKYGGSPAELMSKVIRENSDPDLSKMYKTLKNLGDEDETIFQQIGKDKLTNARELLSDDAIRARRLQEESAGGQYTDEKGVLKLREYENPNKNEDIISADQQDYYAKRRLQEAKITNNLKVLSEESKIIDDELTEAATRFSTPSNAITPKQLSKDLDNYLHAKYALDYNKLRGEGQSGMSTDAAKQYIKDFESRGLNNYLKNSIDTLREQVARTNKLAVDSGLLSTDKLKEFRKVYGENYVPLTRQLDKDTQLMSDNPYEVKVSGIYDDIGSDLEVKSIRENITENLANIARKAELNKTNTAFADLVDNPANKEAASGILKQFNGKNYAKGRGNRDTTLNFFRNGEQYHMDFVDPQLAKVFKGTAQKEMSAITKGIYNLSSSMNRYLGSIYTRLNPDFVIPNLFRDRTEALVNNAVRLGTKPGLQTINPTKALSEDMGIIRKKLNKVPAETAKDRELYRYYDEFVEDGGNVGGLGLTTREDIINTIKKLPDNLDAGTGRKTVSAIEDWVNKVNTMFEDGTRFATYKLARQSGKSRQAAAIAARDSSFDPTLGGTEKGWLRATYLFANPALQASKVFLKNLWKKPKLAATFFGTMMGLKMSIDKWNSSVDPDWEEKLRTTSGSDYIKNKSLVFLTGTKDDGSPSYISVPIGYSMVPFAVTADYMQKALRGKVSQEEVGKASSEIIKQIKDSYNPTGGSLIPTIARPYFELQNNKDGLGRTIRPEWMETRPMAAKERMYSYTMDTYGGEMAYSMAETAEALGLETSPENIKHLYQMFTGGIGGTVGRVVNVASDAYNKGWEGVKAKDIPVARRFFGSGYKQKFEDRAGYQSEIEEFTRIDNTERAKDGRIASDIFRQIRDANEANKPEQVSDVLQEAIELGQLTPSVQRRLKTKFDNYKKGLTQTDARVKQLTVKVRAKYLLDQMKTKSLPELQEYVADQMRKGVLTKNVLTELSGLEEFKNLTLRKVE